jgi:hypothetical protein
MVALAAPSPYQHPCRQHGTHHWKHHGTGSPGYDVETESTVSGIVEKVWTEDCPGCRGCAGGVHLLLKTESATLEAHLGPASFLAAKEWEIAKEDELEATGSMVTYRDGGVALIVREMKKGEKTLTLRDEEGNPLWSRGKPRTR